MTNKKTMTKKKTQRVDDDEEEVSIDSSDSGTETEVTASFKADNDGSSTFYNSMKKSKLQCFPTFEAVNPSIEVYESSDRELFVHKEVDQPQILCVQVP